MFLLDLMFLVGWTLLLLFPSRMRNLETLVILESIQLIMMAQSIPEKKWVDEVVSHTQKNCTYININSEEIIKKLPSMLNCQDEPFGGVPSVAWMLIPSDKTGWNKGITRRHWNRRLFRVINLK